MINNDDKRILVARDNNIVLGYVYGFIQDNGSLYNNKIAQLDDLFVKEQYRGNGIARILMKKFINLAREKSSLYRIVSM